MGESDNDVKRYLESLAEPGLPDDLWQRVDGARRYRVRRRLATVVASAAFVVLAFALVLPGGAPGVADGPQLAVAPPAAVDEADRIRTVQAIDRALQAAYDRDAGEDEIEPLWRARQAYARAAGPAVPGKQG